MKKIWQSSIAVLLMVGVLSACTGPAKPGDASEKQTFPDIGTIADISLDDSEVEQEDDDAYSDETELNLIEPGERKTLQKVKRMAVDTKPVSLKNDSTVFTKKEVQAYVSEFLTKLRAGDEAVINYLAIPSTEDPSQEELVYSYLPTVFNDAEAKEDFLELVNRLKFFTNEFISVPEVKYSKGEEDTRFITYYSLGARPEMLLGIMDKEDIEKHITPLIDDISLVSDESYKHWKPVFDRGQEIAKTISGLNLFSIDGIDLILTKDGEVMINGASLIHNIIFSFPVDYSVGGDAYWDFYPIFDNMDGMSSTIVEDETTNKFFDLYNSGEYSALWKEICVALGNEKDIEYYAEEIRFFENFVKKSNVIPQLRVYLDDLEDTTYLVGGLNPIWQMAEGDIAIPAHWMGVYSEIDPSQTGTGEDSDVYQFFYDEIMKAITDPFDDMVDTLPSDSLL